MVMLRTMRRKSRTMLAGACCLVGAIALVDAAYQGLVYGTVRPVPGLPRGDCRVSALGLENRATKSEPPRLQASDGHGDPRVDGAVASTVCSEALSITHGSSAKASVFK
jgi:hypothetical protein